MDKEYKPYSHPRWTEIPKAFPTGKTVEFTKEEEQRHTEILNEFIRRDQELMKKRREDAGK
ncbi:MAG: hypothetical protein NC548_38775 [Lachnospiraceae bacterium]|nr:hypothetical protein [Lachnospiraceae bacterium]